MKIVTFASDVDKQPETFKYRGRTFEVENSELTAFVRDAQKTWGLDVPDFGAALSKILEHFACIGWITRRDYEQVSQAAFKLGAEEFYRLFNLGRRDFLFPELGS